MTTMMRDHLLLLADIQLVMENMGPRPFTRRRVKRRKSINMYQERAFKRNLNIDPDWI